MILGKVAYEAYAQSVGNSTPCWEELHESSQTAWNEAALAVADEIICKSSEELPPTQPAPEGYPT